MWQSLLKDTQKEILVPPGFTKVQVVGTNKCHYSFTLKKPLQNWSFINAEGKYIKAATENDVYDIIKRYPSIHCCFLQKDPAENNCWLVCSENNVFKLRYVVDSVETPAPLTTIVAKVMGGVLAFHTFNYRDMQPENVDRALEMLHKDDLDPNAYVSWLRPEQRFAFAILAENEVSNRVPFAERKVKEIISTEGANLISMKQTKNGYSVSFRYRGKVRDVRITEELMLQDAGMCLDGHDSEFSLDSFIAVLHYEDRRSEFLPGRGRHWDDEDYDD